jgi:hypothetical protein
MMNPIKVHFHDILKLQMTYEIKIKGVHQHSVRIVAGLSHDRSGLCVCVLIRGDATEKIRRVKQ